MIPLLVFIALAAQPTEADRLFGRARELMKSSPAEACPLFEKSFSLDPALGTLLNLALCLEEVGRTASAWLRFNEAQAWAVRTHESERELLARTRLSALKPKLSWLALTAERLVPGLEVAVDGQALAFTGPQSVPVDPGKHTVRASAPRHEGWEVEVSAPRAGESLGVQVPPLKSLELVEALATVTERTVVITAPAPAENSRAPGVAAVTSGVLVLAASVVGLAWSLDVNSRAQQQRRELVDPKPVVSRADFSTAAVLYPISVAGAVVGLLAIALGVWLLL